MPMSPADLHGMWYPTVRRTLVCLSKLYRCVDVSLFVRLSVLSTMYRCIDVRLQPLMLDMFPRICLLTS